LQEIRNCILHADGWITDDFVTRFAKVGLKVKLDTPLELPKNYFLDAWALVNDAYLAVQKKCWEQFGYAKQEELWLRPARQFSSDDLRQILEEATAAGIAARERATKRLLKIAKAEGYVE